MIRIRRSSERGHFDHGWLDTHHTFSFSRYHDPEHMGFRALRVINEDWVRPEHGFGTHPHDNMEIVTYVLEGVLAHRDSMGTGSEIRPGELQNMTAGTGITHGEFNASDSEPVHLYQIWILPDRDGHAPAYGQRAFPEGERRNRLRLVASPDGEDGSLIIHQDARLYLSTLKPGAEVSRGLAEGRHSWVQVLRGSVMLNGEHAMVAGDGAALSEESLVSLRAGGSEAEVMVFDLN